MDTCCITETKQTVIGIDGGEPHSLSMEHSHVCQVRWSLMSMDNINPFSDENVSDQWEERSQGWESAIVMEGYIWKVVNLETYE